tara:strand:+ start:58 stop:261 length:204 start_codon:yes stop_codon:yes gene_type:complete
MSDVYSTSQPILMLELTDISDNLVVVNCENVLYHHVITGTGTNLVMLGGDTITVKEELTAKWLRDNT